MSKKDCTMNCSNCLKEVSILYTSCPFCCQDLNDGDY